MPDKLKLLASSAMVAVALLMSQASQSMDDILKLGQQQKPSGMPIPREAVGPLVSISESDFNHIQQQLYRTNLLSSSFLSGVTYSFIPEIISRFIPEIIRSNIGFREHPSVASIAVMLELIVYPEIIRSIGFREPPSVSSIAAMLTQAGVIGYNTFYASYTPTVAPVLIGILVKGGTLFLFNRMNRDHSDRNSNMAATIAAVLTTVAQDVFICGETPLDSVLNYGTAFIGSCAGIAFALNAESLVRRLWGRGDRIDQQIRALQNRVDRIERIVEEERRLAKMGQPIPSIAQGYEEVYRRFLNGALVYRPSPGNDEGMIKLPIWDLANPLEGTFDLSHCGDTGGKYWSISTGYRKGKKPENANKIEIWICPRFLIDKELDTTASHFSPIMGHWIERWAPVGLFWNWGGWDDMDLYDYLVSQNMDKLSNRDLGALWWQGWGVGGIGGRHLSWFPCGNPRYVVASTGFEFIL